MAVVMYGGISLAVYMNGIAQELLAMVRSTAVEDRNTNSPMLNDLKGTETIYRELAHLLSDERDGGVHVRFVIDIISGTSAGGINGVFLAKALARRKDILSLKRTWVEQGDFQKLLNDQTQKDLSLPKQVPPRSLLSGERMYALLFEAFAEMDANPGQSYVEDLQLSVTATDLLGKVMPLRLADRVVWERRYKQVFQLKYSDDPGVDHFTPEYTPFLAFVARCTSSFPVAFEPMQLASIPRLVRASWKYGKNYDGPDSKWETLFAEWQPFFGPEDPSVADRERFFADGGYLDNRPFDHAVAGLARQSSTVPYERKLFYIEPSPEHPERENNGKDKDGKLIQPNAIENAWDGLAGIPGKQPIRDSLLEIQQRNRIIRKVNNVITEISDAVAASPLTIQARESSGHTVDRNVDKVARNASLKGRPGFRAYQTLSVYAVTDDLAIRIARAMRIDENSDYVYAIRCLIKVWREKAYRDNEGKFLLDFDISYRMRRYQFVKSQLQMLSRLDRDAETRLARLGLQVDTEDQKAAFRKEIDPVWRALHESFLLVRTAYRLAATGTGIIDKIKQLNLTPENLNYILGVDSQANGQDFVPAPVSDNSYEKRAQKLLTPERENTLQELRDAIVDHYGAAMSVARDDVTQALTGAVADSPMRKAVLKVARDYFYGFWEFDAAVFPIVYGTDVGELVPVDVVRVSPEDAIAIQDESKTGWPKLAGTSFGNFGAFLERVWRTNDILWGRLDGAERIIRALAAGRGDVDGLIKRAHDQIIAEELTPDGRREICTMLLDALLADGAVAGKQARQTMKQIEEYVRAACGSTDINPKLLAVLRGALNTDDLRQALATFEIGREPNRKTTLVNVARSTRIIGRMLDDIGDKYSLLKKPGTLLVQAGSALWGLVEVATPRSIWQLAFRYWFGLLLLFSVVMIAGGTLFSQPAQSLGFRLLVLALATRLAVSALRTYIQGSKWGARALEALLVLVVLALLGLGGIGLIELPHAYHQAIEAARKWVSNTF